jgi:hypothetical protein
VVTAIPAIALPRCFIGGDHNVERIADTLSSKYLGAAAMELRDMARTPPPPEKPSLLARLTPLLEPGRFKRLFGNRLLLCIDACALAGPAC